MGVNLNLFTLILCIIALALPVQTNAQRLLIPMDLTQSEHLKAYGLALWVLDRGIPCEWLLNYRGGSFLIESHKLIAEEAQVRGIITESVSEPEVASIYADIDAGNMEVVRLDQVPRIAVYTPPNSQPWDDAVTLVLEYADIEYERQFDQEVLAGKLTEYDWLHLHHEDFTGQYGKFYASYRSQPWYQDQQRLYESMAAELGFPKVSEQKKAVARKIRDYMNDGGFMFAMCSATDTFDIALAAEGTDISPAVFDGDPAHSNAQENLDYNRCVAFENFSLELNPMVYEHSNIDTTPRDIRLVKTAEAEYFTLFEFSAKYHPVPSMLTQCHTNVINGFLGQTTAFHSSVVKKSVTILAEVEGRKTAKYIHGRVGKGTFTFYGGHDPEDHKHHVGDPPTRLSLFPNSPGYRLILNNVLFPAAKKKERKT